MAESKKIILVLSNQYFDDPSCVHFDLLATQDKVAQDGVQSILMVLLEADAAAHPTLPKILRNRIENREVIEWPGETDPDAKTVFWQQLKDKLDMEIPPLDIQ